MSFSPRIGMVVETSGGNQVLFRSSTRGRNELTLSLTNVAGNGDLLLSKDGPASLVLNVPGLCSASELAGVNVTASGWVLKQKDGKNQVPLTLSPTQNLRWRDGEVLPFKISLGAVGIGAKLGLKPIQVTLHDLRCDEPDQVCASKTLNDFVTLVEEPEHPQNPLRKALSFTIERVEPTTPESSNLSDVYTAVGRPYTIANQLRLTIRNLSEKTTLLSARKNDSRPMFTLVFPTVPMGVDEDDADSYGSTALTTVDLAQAIKVTPTSDSKHRWSALSPGSETLVCEITPEPDNKLLFAPGGALELLISDVKTSLPAFATQVYLLHNGFDGFDEGYEVVPLRKAVPDPQIISFIAEPVDIYCGEPVRLSWSVLGADRVELSYSDGGSPKLLSSAKGSPRLGLPVGEFEDLPYAKETPYTLSLYKSGRKVLDRTVTVHVVMPVLEFRTTPSAAALEERVSISWNLIGQWAFEGRLMEGNTLLQKILKPAGTPMLSGSMTQTATSNRYYRLTGQWATPVTIEAAAEATLTIVAPIEGISRFAMSEKVDQVFGELLFRWNGKNVTRYAIGHCEKDTVIDLDRISTYPGEGRQLTDVFRIVEIDADNVWGGVNFPMNRFIPWPEEGPEPTLQWCNDQLAQRDFYLLAWGEKGTSSLPIVQKAELLSRERIVDQ